MSSRSHRPLRLSRVLRCLPLLALVAASTGGVVAAGTPAAAKAAAPGTLLYVKGHNVYVALPDGTGERALTTDGTAAEPWVSPSGADDGTVAAARGPVVYRMDQWGTVLNSFDPPDTTDTAGAVIGGNVAHVAISPDGSKIAYTYQHYSCPPLLSCKTRWVTSISAADRLTPPTDYGPSPYDNPTWVSGSRLLLNGRDTEGIVAFDIGAKNSYWFDDGDGTGYFTGEVTEPTLSRDSTVFAALYKGFVATYQVTGDVRSGSLPGTPTPVCALSNPGGISNPSLAPDGTAIATQEPDGVWVKPQPLVCDAPATLVLPGATEPFWSAAALQTTRPEPPGPQQFDVVKKPTVKGAAKVGKRLKAVAVRWVPAPTKVSYQWLRNGKRIAKATKASYRVTKADRGRKISVRVTASRAGYAKSAVTSKAVRAR